VKTFRVTIEPRSPLGTAFQADTLFGHFCWTLAGERGEKALAEFLAAYDEGRPALVFSSGFPAGYLPRPLAPSSRPEERKTLEDLILHEKMDTSRTAARDRLKKLRKSHWFPRRKWPEVREKLSEGRILSMLLGEKEGPAEPKPFDRLQNTLGRITGRTLEEGGLHSSETEVYPSGSRIDFYIRQVEPPGAFPLQELESLVRKLFLTGFGRDASTGGGHCEVVGFEDDSAFFQPEGSHALALSNFIPCEALPVKQGFYRLVTKFGKLGPGLSTNPFKKPMLMAEAGSVWPVSEVRPWFGRWLDSVHAERSEVRHHALMLPLYCCLEEA
jgi:CRISPR-associated protein Csm4